MSPPTNNWRQRRIVHLFFYAEIITVTIKRNSERRHIIEQHRKNLKNEQPGPAKKTTGELVKGKQFLLLIIHPPGYSYIQSSDINVYRNEREI